MSGNNDIPLRFTADTRDLEQGADRVERSLGGVGQSMNDTAKSARAFDDHIEGVGDGLGNTSGKLTATNDLVQGFSDTVGLSLPPQAGMIMGFADMASGLSELLGPALKGVKGAMAAMNATIAANPLIATIAVIALLAAAFVIAYKKSETFRNIVHAAMHGASAAIGWVIDKGKQLWGFFSSLGEKIGGAFKGLAEIITTPYRLAFSAIAGLWNNTVGRLSFSIPSWVPGIGGHGFDVPDIPTFANGGLLPGGLALVGERGPELIAGGAGARVFTAGQTSRMLGGGGTMRLEVDVRGGEAAMRQMIRGWVKKAGSVDKAFA